MERRNGGLTLVNRSEHTVLYVLAHNIYARIRKLLNKKTQLTFTRQFRK